MRTSFDESLLTPTHREEMGRAQEIHDEHCVKETLQLACADQRIVTGLSACAETLDIDPDSVFVCLLPADANYPLFTTLIRSGCAMTGVALAMVRSHESLAQHVGFKEAQKGTLDCLLILRPEKLRAAELHVETLVLGTDPDSVDQFLPCL